MIDEFELLLNECYGAFAHESAWRKGRDLAFGALNCMGRHTLTGLLTASGQQFMDWSSAYRLFSKKRIDNEKLFDVIRMGVLKELNPDQALVAHMDDTILKKTGTHIPGAAWRRDPLGPPFQTNLIWGQRFLQISMALPDYQNGLNSRAVPVDFHHCPTLKKPSKNADLDQWKNFNEQKRQLTLSTQGSQRLADLRNALDRQGAQRRQLIISVDGSYTNGQVLKNLPERVTLIGRIRKNTKLYDLPEQQPALGRKRVYGERLPTPEQIRQSDQYHWQEVKAWAAGKEHVFNVKVINNALWRTAGQNHVMQLVVIRPLRYKLSKHSKILYRDPVYLICTDNNLNISELLQDYLWRWEIEVNFREEKTLMGCGQAQVRNPESAERVPAYISAIYSLLHLASYRSLKSGNQTLLPRSKWYKKGEAQRHTTGDIINNLKAQLWAKVSGMSFSGFVNLELKSQSQRNAANPIKSAILYARN